MDWRTKLLLDQDVPTGFQSLSHGIYRASTTVFNSLAETAEASWKRPYTYGIYGTPTTHELALRLAALFGGSHTLLTPSGQASLALVNLAIASPGDHILLPENAYGNHADIGATFLPRLGIETTFYPTHANLKDYLRPNTRLVWFESPGSITMEVEDIPAHLATVRAHNPAIITAIDDTYAAGVLMRPFDMGIDLTAQALTKYPAGHADLVMGSVTVRHGADDLYDKLGTTHRQLGYSVSPEDCFLVLRGMHTLPIRLEAIEKSTLAVAEWCKANSAIEFVLHPALPDCPGHEIFKRDFTGSAGLFSIILREGTTSQQAEKFVDSLKLFALGYSWGGTRSVVMSYPYDTRIAKTYGHRLVRLGIGLEALQDLIVDITQALATAGL